MAEFEELRLTVSLVDNASAGLARLRTEISRVTTVTDTMTAGLNSSAKAVVNFGNVSQTAAPQLRSATAHLREMTRTAAETGRAIGQMGLLARQGFGGIPAMSIAFWDASRGVSQLAAGMALVGPTARVATLALGGISVGVVAVGAAAIAYGISVFRMAKEMDALDKTAKTLGVSFSTLKGAQDQAKAAGESADVVTRNFQGIQAAQLDLFNRNSQLKNQLLVNGVGEEWIKAFSTADPRQAFNMIRSFSKRMEATLIEQGWAPGAAMAMAQQFAKEFGVSVGDLPELLPISPETAANMEQIKILSTDVMNIWNPLSVKLEALTLEALKEGLPLLEKILSHTDGIIAQIKIELKAVGEIFKAVKMFSDLLRHPVDTFNKINEDDETRDQWTDLLIGQKGTTVRDTLEKARVKPADAAPQNFGGFGNSGPGDEDISSWRGGNSSVWDSFRKSDNIEDRRDESISVLEDDVTQTGALVSQLARLNSFFDRLEAKSIQVGGARAGGGLGLLGGGGGYGSNGGNYGGNGSGGDSGGSRAAGGLAGTSDGTVGNAQDSGTRYGDSSMRTSGASGKINDNDLYKTLYNNVPSELIGVVPKDGARFGIRTGSREEWAKLQFKLAQQESSGSTTPGPEAGHAGTAGLYQFEQKDLDRWGGNGRVTDPNAQIRAMNNVFKKNIIRDNAIGGQDSWPGRSDYGAGAYFGPLRDAGVNRGAIARHEAAGARVVAANRAELDRASTTTANAPSISGGLKADVDAPAGTKVEVTGSGAFKQTETTRRVGPTVERAADLARAN